MLTGIKGIEGTYSSHSAFTLSLMLVPMFLIMSSSIYPAILSGIENKEMKMVAEALSQLEVDNIGPSSLNSYLPTPSYQDLIPSSSPTPIDSTFSTSHTVKESGDTPTTMQQQDEEVDKVTATTISAANPVHVIWEDDTSGAFDIFYKRDGADFDPTKINLSNNAGASTVPAIAVSGNNVHIVWQDNTSGNAEILYRRSTDGGATFGPTINLSNDVPSSLQPTIAVSDGIVHVAWADDIPDDDIFYRRSTDGGVSFTEPIKNLSGSAGQSARPAIAVSGNMVHVVWDDSTTGNRDILYRRSLDGGSTFPNIIKNLSGDPEGSSFPAIAVSGNNVHVVWNAGSEGGNFDILYRRSLDGGSTFPNIIKNLSNNMGISGFAAIAVSGNNLHVVWEDDTPDPLRDILYRRSTDGGATFTDPIKNLSSNGGQSNLPAIALSGSNVYVVWYDNTIGGYQVLYRTSSNSGDTFPQILTNLSENAGISLANLGPGIGVS